MDGKTPEMTIQQARALLGSLGPVKHRGLRDRAVLGVLTYTGARVGALARLRRGISRTRNRSGSCDSGKREASSERFRCDTIWTSGSPPTWKPAASTCQQKTHHCFGGGKGGGGAHGSTHDGARGAADAQAALKDAGLAEIITPHSFRVMVVTDLLGQNVPMEDVQYLAGHSNPRPPRSMTAAGGG